MSECYNIFEINQGHVILTSENLRVFYCFPLFSIVFHCSPLFPLFSIVLYCFLLFFQTYRDFHQDVFPDTFTGDASMTAEEWFAGQNKPVSIIGPQETQGNLRCAQLGQ